jgi:hypothetical protein
LSQAWHTPTVDKDRDHNNRHPVHIWRLSALPGDDANTSIKQIRLSSATFFYHSNRINKPLIFFSGINPSVRALPNSPYQHSVIKLPVSLSPTNNNRSQAHA